MVMLLRFAPPAVAAVMLALVVTGGPLALPARTIAIACIIASTLAALVMRRPDVRTHTTVALAVGAFVATGQIRAGGRYALGATIFVGVVIACLRVHRMPADSTAASAFAVSGRRRAALVLALASFALGGLLVWRLPRIGARVEARVARWLGTLENDEVTGFSSTMRLGSTHGMLESDRIVLRIEGDASRVEYLRGATYDRYFFGEWTSSTDTPPRTVVAATLPPEQATTRIVQARTARVAMGIDARWFVPAGACDFGTPTGKLTVDRGAVLHPDISTDGAGIWFRMPAHGDACTAAPPPSAAPPGPLDLDIDPNIAGDVRGIAAEWTAGATDERAKIAAIEQRLSRFQYSLDVRRNAHYDAIVDFLRLHQEGHCELFASAMALLARAQGIPARVVTGYRGGEVNRVGGYTVVRERNAHAWVEAWVDGKWRAFDPTPPIDGLPRETGTVSAALDVVSYAFDRGLLVLARITLFEWGIGLGIVAAVLYLVREITRRLARVRGRGAGSIFGEGEAALPAFDALADALAAAGHARPPSEPIESFARRVAKLESRWAAAASDALSRYAALRYGNAGDERAVVSALEDATVAARRAS